MTGGGRPVADWRPVRRRCASARHRRRMQPMTADRFLPSSRRVRVGLREDPDHPVRADHNDAAARGHAYTLGTMRAPVRGIGWRMPGHQQRWPPEVTGICSPSAATGPSTTDLNVALWPGAGGRSHTCGYARPGQPPAVPATFPGMPRSRSRAATPGLGGWGGYRVTGRSLRWRRRRRGGRLRCRPVGVRVVAGQPSWCWASRIRARGPQCAARPVTGGVRGAVGGLLAWAPSGLGE
jgi:hypothetical protein